jgi:tRNA pseudouridine32 synthase/23S rRNA pseudouridine746 synthase
VQEDAFVINQSLDGKDAVTRVQVLASEGNTSLLDVVIETGRKHQIRRHLSALGHPVVGDSLYGEKAPQGLHLSALSLAFECPVRGRKILVTADENEIHRYWR